MVTTRQAVECGDIAQARVLAIGYIRVILQKEGGTGGPLARRKIVITDHRGNRLLTVPFIAAVH